MKVIITPSKITGAVTVPASKSMTHRALICAALGSGTTTLANILRCDDTDATIAGLRAFGVTVEEISPHEVQIAGTGGKLTAPQQPINLGASGTSLRFFIALAAIAQGTTTITGTQRLLERPLGNLERALISQGARIEKTTDGIQVTGGKLPGGIIEVNAAQSSQFVSALLLIAPFAQHDTHIAITNLTSKPYIQLTVEMLKQFGIQTEVLDKSDSAITITVSVNQKYNAVEKCAIEGDWSAASYFFAANTLGATLEINGLKSDSIQADQAIVAILHKIPGVIAMGNTPDSVPTVAVAAAFQNGTTTITNISHLRGKESDRIAAIATNLNNMGIETSLTQDSLTIMGGKPHGAIIATFDDHRIAMSFAIAGLFANGPTTIENAECVAKSYPNFWNDLRQLGANFKPLRFEKVNFEANSPKNKPLRFVGNIILIGMRGSGKSTLGRQLAKNLHKEFIETDVLIEQMAGKPIADIVAQDGWEAFRALEKKVCKQVCTTITNAVIATGGGIILDETNRNALQKAGLIVYLTADIEILIDRVARQPTRPFLTDAQLIEDDMREVFRQRQELYEQTADVQMEVTDIPHINPATKLCAVFGNPVSHSLSPAMHNATYRKLGIDFVFLKLQAGDSQKVIEAIRALGIHGAAITVPFKQAIMKYLDDCDETAQTIGAVNTVLNKDGKLHGANTDWIGAIKALGEKTEVKGKTVALLGAGGSARAIVYGLKKEGSTVFIFNRNQSSADKIAKDFELAGSFNLGTTEKIRDCDIIINATPIGMNEDASLLPPEALRKDQIVFDIVYSPKMTGLLQYAKSVGAHIITGDRMLLHQAVAQFELFTGHKAPVGEMERVLMKSL